MNPARRRGWVSGLLGLGVPFLLAAQPAPPPERQAFFGDLHLHTALSFDAFITGTRALPDDAYRYGRGEAIAHQGGGTVRLAVPLDFMAVTDHGELLGSAQAMADPNEPLSRLDIARDVASGDYERSHSAFRRIVAAGARREGASLFAGADPGPVARSAWQRVIAAAQAHNRPGEFTTFIGYEWSALPDMANLHRNVIFAGDTAPPLPYTSIASTRPEDLWRFLDDWRQRGGGDVLAIPHNSNASKGLMFPLVDSDGAAIGADYAERRMRNEPLVEITQAKGTSETHTALAPLDEFAGFELWNNVVGGTEPVEPVAGSYVRSAYARGLLFEQTIGANPYRFGLIGSTDNHDGTSAVEEDNFTGGHGNADATAAVRLDSRPSTLTLSSLNFSASGLAGVWAEANSREAIFAALRRKETFATSGTRIRVRFFAGEDLPADLAERADAVAAADAAGVPMGGDTTRRAHASAGFYVWALRDPRGAALDRVQIVKVAVVAGETSERIIDVACADGRVPDPASERCPPTAATVDTATCAPSAGGAGELEASWRDPHFAESERAAYYVRVIENPTCRYSTWDAIRLGVAPPAAVPATIQERAWTSPIWVRAEG